MVVERYKMKVEGEVTVNIDTQRIENKIDNNDAFWIYAANEWHRLISPWTPFRTGNLMRNVTITPKTIKYNAPYAWTVYHDTERNYNKKIHPLATARWDESAKPSQLSKLNSALQKLIDNGMLDLNE